MWQILEYPSQKPDCFHAVNDVCGLEENQKPESWIILLKTTMFDNSRPLKQVPSSIQTVFTARRKDLS